MAIERIPLTEKQKNLLFSLNEQKLKIEQQYHENGKRIDELVEFILDANHVPVEELVSVNLEGTSLVYSLKEKEVVEIDPPDTAVV